MQVWWSSIVTADYYLQTGKVMDSDLVAASLAMSTAPSPIEGEPLASVVTRSFSDKNEMRNLSLAFPYSYSTVRSFKMGFLSFGEKSLLLFLLRY